MRKLAIQQPMMDEINDEYTPLLNEQFEVVPNLGRVTLSEVIFRGDFSIIFGINEYSHLVIKYQSNCDCRSDDIHPLLPDFWMGSIASSVGVGPNPQFISPTAVIPPFETIKTMFEMSADRRDRCVQRKGTVRYMVMDRVGPSLHLLPPRADGTYLDIRTGLGITVKILKLVQRIHSAGIIHGDIHGGNICLTPTGELTLIDFGSAVFLDAESDDAIRPRFEWVDIALTPWQMEGFEFSRQDDVYKVLVNSMYMIVGTELEEMARFKFEQGPEEFQIWKQDEIGFHLPYFDPVDYIEWLSSDQRLVIREGLDDVVGTVCDLSSTKEPIPYAYIITNLERLLRILTPPTSMFSSSNGAASRYYHLLA